MEKIKRLAYGISDFRQVMREDKYYVDKTMYLPVMENTDNFLFLIRPRRFASSSAYYLSLGTNNSGTCFRKS